MLKTSADATCVPSAARTGSIHLRWRLIQSSPLIAGVAGEPKPGVSLMGSLQQIERHLEASCYEQPAQPEAFQSLGLLESSSESWMITSLARFSAGWGLSSVPHRGSVSPAPCLPF